MSKKWYYKHAEALTQNIVGMIIAFIILHLFGMSFSDSVGLQATFFVTSYIRSYMIRSLFERIK